MASLNKRKWNILGCGTFWQGNIVHNGSTLFYFINFNIESENNFLLELLAAGDNSETKTDLVMYFTVKLAFVNYFDSVIESLGIPVLRNWTIPGTNFALMSGIN